MSSCYGTYICLHLFTRHWLTIHHSRYRFTRNYSNCLSNLFFLPVIPHTKVFHMCWSLSDGSSKFIPIDKEANHQIVHAFRLGEAQRATHQPLDPGPEIDVFALDFLRVLLAYVMLLDIDMPLIGPPAVGVILGDAKGL